MPPTTLQLRAIPIMTLVIVATLSGCAVPFAKKESTITITAAEAAALAEATAHDAAQAASLADKLHRDAFPSTDQMNCYTNHKPNGLIQIRRDFTIEGLSDTAMMTSARTIRDHLVKNGWVITNDRTTDRPEFLASGTNPHNGIYALVDAGNHGILLTLASGCLKPGTLTTTPPPDSSSPLAPATGAPTTTRTPIPPTTDTTNR